MIKQIKRILIITIMTILSLTFSSNAFTIRMSTDKNEIKTGDEVVYTINLDENVVAANFDISYNSSSLELIGYPIWWEIAAWPVDTFVKANDFSGKTVIPFCTSSSSGLGQSGELLREKANSGNWIEGHRFSSNPSDSDVKTWTDSLDCANCRTNN